MSPAPATRPSVSRGGSLRQGAGHQDQGQRDAGHTGGSRVDGEGARKAKIPYQREVLIAGATDAASMQLSRAGVKSGCLSIPCRYVHTTSETVDINDVENGVKLLVTLLEGKVEA